MSAMVATNPETISRRNPSHALNDFLDGCRFLNGFSEQHQQTLSDCAMFQDFAGGEKIFNEGDPANRFYLIIDGEVALESCDGDNEPVLIEKIGEGGVLGWSWLFPPYYWNFGARATKPTKAVFLYGTRLRQICEQDPALGCELMKRIATVVIQRLQATRKELLDIAHRRR